MSCGCQNSSSNCNGCTPCNCCPPAPPCNPPVCKDPEPCDVALDSKCVIYTGGTLECIGITAGQPPIIKLDKVIETLDDKICQVGLGITYTEDSDCINVTGTGSSTDPLIVSTTIASDPLNIIECTEDGLFASVTANNGLNKVGNAVRLGGNLIVPTTVTTDPTNTLTVAGLVTDPAPSFIITQASSGQLVKTLASSIIPTPTPATTANNGLNMSTPTNVQLGGPLIQNTSVDLDTYSLTFRSGVSGQTGIQIIPGAIQECVTPGNSYDWTTDVFNIWSKIQQNGKSWFKDNVGIGLIPDSDNPSCGNGFKLNVFKPTTSFNNTFSAGRGTTTSTFEMIGALGNDASNGEITSSIVGSLYFSSSTNVDLYGPAKALYSGINGRVTFTGANGNLKTEGYPAPANSQGGPGGALTGVASRGLFHDFGAVKDPANTGPSLATYIGFQALAPQPYRGNTYTGTIDDVVGVQIEDQRGSGIGNDNTDRLAGKGLVTNSWGVRQLGALDRNYFSGNTGIGGNPYPALDTDLTTPNANNAKLFVARSSGFRNSSLTTASDNLLEFTLSGAESPNIIAGLTGRINPAPTANVTIAGGSRIAAVYGYMQYTGTFDITNGLRNGLTGVFGQCSFSSGGTASPTGGDVTHAVALRAGRPLYVNFSYYGGTIANAYGLYIEDQRDDIDDTTNAGYITNSYGVYQEGARDTNYFNGPFQLPSSNLSIGTATLGGGTGTVTVSTTAVKTGAKIFLSVNTPGGTQGFLSAPAASITNGVSFVINSTSATDTSTVNWWIINN